MQFQKYFRALFILWILGAAAPQLSAQKDIKINMKVHSVRAYPGMPDYENYDRTPGYTKPDLNFLIYPAYILSNNFFELGIDWVGFPITPNPNRIRRFFYENKPSETIHYLPTPSWALGDEDVEFGNTIVNNEFDITQPINLRDKWAFAINTGYEANEDDRPFQFGFGGDDDYRFTVPTRNYALSHLAYQGNGLGYIQLSTAVYTHTHHDGNLYPYYVVMKTTYELDALSAQLSILNPDGTPGSTFCEGQPIKIRANYKSQFYNGYFQWQKDHGDGIWRNFSNYDDNVIDDVVTKNRVRYRARLMATGSSYGVQNFNGSKCIGYTGVGAIEVQSIIKNFTFEKVDACPGAMGTARLTHINEALEGHDYTVSFYEGVALKRRDTIYNFSSTYLSENDISYSNFSGNYKIQVLNLDEGLQCGIRKNFTINASVFPEFMPLGNDPNCFGDDGTIVFNNILFKDNVGPFNHTLTATSNTGSAVFTKEITALEGFLSVPPDSYTVKIENADGCSYTHSSNIVITDKIELTASVPALPTFPLNGENYHGECWHDTFEATVNIAGGVGPYKVTVQNTANGGTKAYQLLEGENTITIPGLGHADYLFTISDFFDCMVDPIPFTINNPPKLDFDNFEALDPSLACGAVNIDGTITSDIVGGIPPYTLYFDGAEVSAFDTSTLANGTYSLLIEDSFGCTAARTVELTNPEFLRMSDKGSIPYNFVPCDSFVRFFITVEGGYLENWGDMFTFKMNGIDCASNPNCSEVPGSFYWGWWYYNETSSITYQIDVDTTSLQTFEVSDDLGCMLSSSYKFESPLAIGIGGVTAVPPTCVGGAYETTFYLEGVNASTFGDDAPLQYNLDGVSGNVQLNTEDGTTATPPIVPYEITLPIADPGNHNLTVTDYLGCSSVNPFSFDLAPIDSFKLTILNVENARCAGDSSGSFTIELTTDPPFIVNLNGDIFTIYDNVYTIANLAPDYYNLIVTNKHGCEVEEPEVFVDNPTVMTASATSSSLIDCTGENGVIEVAGVTGGNPPYKYALNDRAFQSSSTLTGATIENTILVKDAVGCFMNLNVSIPVAGPTLFSTLSPYEGASDCANGSAIINIQPGFTEPMIVQPISSPVDYIATPIVEYGTVVATVIFRDTLENLPLGKHYFLIQDGLGCQLIDSVTIVMADTLTAAVTLNTFETCYQQSADGIFNIAITGGKSPYTITHDGENFQSTSGMAIYTDLSYGVYNFQVEDASGCFYSFQDSIIAGALPSAESTLGAFSGCTGDSLQVAVSLTGASGKAPYTFTWEDGVMADQRSVLAPKEYQVTVTDADGCWAQELFITPELDTLNIDLKTVTDAVCQADANGSIAVSTHGGFTPYSFSIDGGENYQTDSTFNGLTIGDYEIIVKDNHDCLDTISTIITFTNALNASTNSTDVNCFGANDGTLTATILGGMSPFSYSLNNVDYQAANTFGGLAPGTYDIWIQDGSGCKAVYFNHIIKEPAPLIVTTNILINESCDQANGSASGMASGGVPPHTYEWDGDPTLNTLTLSNASAGVHILKVTDANGCEKTSSVTIENIAGPTLILESSANEICGSANGTIDLQIVAGTAPYTFSWSHDASLTDSLAVDLVAGSYQVTVEDANGCTNILNTTIENIEGPTLSILSTTNSLCTDDNGTINLALNNGTAPFTYNWSHDATLNMATATNLPQGNYSVTVIDGNGCMDEVSTSIDFSAPPSIATPVVVGETCDLDNAAITIEVSGGTGNYQYAWAHDAGLNTPELLNINNGSYDLTVSDDLGCTASVNNIIVERAVPPSLTIASFVNADCLNPLGSITIERTNGRAPFTYAWSHDPNETGLTVAGLSSGTYTASVVDADGCLATISQSLISFVGSSSITSTLNCFGDDTGAIGVTLEGNLADYTFAWSDPSINPGPNAANLSAGIYTVSVTNSNGCMESYTEEIIAPEQIQPNISNVIPVGCFGNLGSAEAMPSGGIIPYSFLWNDGNGQNAPTAINLEIGSYEVTVTDQNGCTNFETVLIEQAPEIVLAEGSMTTPLCQGDDNGSIEILASGGFGALQYVWSNAQMNNTATALTAGDFTLTVNDAVGCQQVIMITLAEPDALALTTSQLAEVLCAGDENAAVTVAAEGGTGDYIYQWNDAMNQTTAIASDLPIGDYQVTVTDENLCMETSNISIDEPEELTIENIVVEMPTCVGEVNGGIVVEATGGSGNYEYNWNGGMLPNSNTLSELPSASYILEIVDENGCTVTTEVEVVDPDPISIVEAIITPGICSDIPSGAIAVTAGGGDGNLNFSWSNGGELATAEQLSGGAYTVTITDGQGCSLEATYDITASQVDFINLGSADSTVCNGTVLHYDFSGAPFETFSWSSAADGTLSTESIFSISNEDTYYFAATNEEGCTVRDTINVNYAAGNLDAFFIAPTDIVVGDTLVAVELSLPVPDQIDWTYDDSAVELVGQEGNQYLFAFSEVGTFDLGMSASLGNCSNAITKQIFVYADSTEIPFVNPLVPTIIDVRLFPNPNNGIFTIEVDLSATQDMVIDIFDTQSKRYDRAIFSGADTYANDYNLTLPTGLYYAIIQVAGERRSLTLVVD